MSIALWAAQAATPGHVGHDARLRNYGGGFASHDNRYGQAGWDMGLNYNTFDDLIGQLRRGAEVPDWIEERERSAGGCSWSDRILHTFSSPPSYIQRCAGPNRAVRRGEIRRLAINMHGYPGGLMVDGDSERLGHLRLGITAERFGQYLPRLRSLFEFTEYDATILFMGCMAGQGAPGTALLRRFSTEWPTRTFVAFITIGVIAAGGMHDTRPGEGIDTEPGMRDSNYTSAADEHHNFTTTTTMVNGRSMSEWESYPWASETSTHAKVIRDGRILRWGGETPQAQDAAAP